LRTEAVQRNVDIRQPTSIDFYDGYVFRFLQDAASDNSDGLYNYYRRRVEHRQGGLADYEAALVSYLLSAFPPDTAFVYVGVGIGTTTALLAAMGRRVAGIEGDHARMVLARRLRDAVVGTWPEAEPRYALIEGYYPDVLDALPRGPGSVLFFTNFVAT